MTNKTTSFLLLRLAVGASQFGHGLVRLPKLKLFSQGMVKSFEKSLLPKIMVLPFSYGLPIAEFAVGVFILIGLFTRPALIAGGLIMILLIFGTTMIENWDALPSQLIHAAFFGVLLSYIEYNSFSVDKLIGK